MKRKLFSGAGTRTEKRRTVRRLLLLGFLILSAAVLLTVIFSDRDAEKDGDGRRPGEDAAPDDEVFGDYIDYFGFKLIPESSVQKNEYDVEAFYYDDIFTRYDTPEARCGIDVSTYQGEIDWAAVADAGVDFAMIRVGFMGYVSGTIHLDDRFVQNIEGATAAGLDVGVYFFSQAVSVEEAEEEADFVLAAIEGYTLTYPVVFDWEIVGSENARTNGLPGSLVTDCAIAFCERVRAAGLVPAVYFNTELGYLVYELSRIDRYVFWLADYRDTPAFYYHFDLWQYTSQGRVPGIEADVDLNLSFRTYKKA